MADGRRITENERIERARDILAQYERGRRFVDIARQLGVTRSLISIEMKWFMEKHATADEQRRYSEASKKRIITYSDEEMSRRFGRTREMMTYVMEGHTLVQTAKHFGCTPGAISKAIVSYERHDPETVARYREVAGTHRFGHYRGDSHPKRDASSRNVSRPSKSSSHISPDAERMTDSEFSDLLESVVSSMDDLDREQ